VSVSVLVFFWGAFSLVSAAARRAPWFLVPCLAVLAYGWTFMMGFFNYYLSLGLSFFALALWWRGRGNERFLALALAPLIYLAHPLGLAWLVGAAVYITIAGAVSGRGQILLLAAVGVVLAGVAAFISSHFPGPWEPVPGIAANGTDQALLNAPPYLVPARLWLAFGVIFILADLVGRRREQGVWAQYSLPLQLYTVALMGVSLIPGAFQFPLFATPIMFLTHRLSSLCAALLCCVLGVMKPRRWHLVGFAMMALIYFSHLYNDTASVIRMESQAEQLVATLPDGQRVIPDLWSSSVLVDLSNHIVDRACIGRCFSLSNYEPSSRQFRVRASPGNRIVVSNPGSSMAMQTGSYVVQQEDLPLYQIYLCERRAADLCLRELPVGAIH
jgi:hypothetical protein